MVHPHPKSPRSHFRWCCWGVAGVLLADYDAPTPIDPQATLKVVLLGCYWGVAGVLLVYGCGIDEVLGPELLVRRRCCWGVDGCCHHY